MDGVKFFPISASLEKNIDDLLKTAWTEEIIVTQWFSNFLKHIM